MCSECKRSFNEEYEIEEKYEALKARLRMMREDTRKEN